MKGVECLFAISICVVAIFAGQTGAFDSNLIFDKINTHEGDCLFSNFVGKYGQQEFCEEYTPKINLKYFENNPSHHPAITFLDAGPGNYTLLMVDPDAPSREHPTFKYFLHWGLTNISGDIFMFNEHKDMFGQLTGKEKEGSYNVFMDYFRPSPPSGMGSHRYQFFLYEETETLTGLVSPQTRGRFNLESFVENNNLILRGFAMFVTENTGS